MITWVFSTRNEFLNKLLIQLRPTISCWNSICISQQLWTEQINLQSVIVMHTYALSTSPISWICALCCSCVVLLLPSSSATKDDDAISCWCIATEHAVETHCVYENGSWSACASYPVELESPHTIATIDLPWPLALECTHSSVPRRNRITIWYLLLMLFVYKDGISTW